MHGVAIWIKHLLYKIIAHVYSLLWSLVSKVYKKLGLSIGRTWALNEFDDPMLLVASQLLGVISSL